MKLLFIFSLPRSGSTLSQRILSAHEDIATAPESHVLLPFLYLLDNDEAYSIYSQRQINYAIRDFLHSLSDGVDGYYSELRAFVLRLYARALQGSDSSNYKYFVDKAPRYYFIAEEILRLFPDGKFVLIWRNPLAIVASIVGSWYRGRWILRRSFVDLYEGPLRLLDACEKHGHRMCIIRYEDLITNPLETCSRLFAYLKLPFDASVLSRFADIRFSGRVVGDKIGTERYRSLNQEPLEKWKGTMSNPLRKAWCRRYLRWLGQERLASMGYDLADLLAQLDAIPLNYSTIISDLWRMPYDRLYRVLELHIMKRRRQKIRNGQRAYMHW
jgi:hypothetical protein